MNNQIHTSSLKIDSLYSDPKNLIYYLLSSDFTDLHAKIIKKQKIATHLGTVEIAIIGASHYFKLENNFIEILSCLHENANDKCFEQRKSFETLHISKTIKNLNYTCAVRKDYFSNKLAFEVAENQIYQQENTLIHAFDGKSAITALVLNQQQDSLVLKTWHSYPESLVVVYSESELIIQDS